MGIGRKVAQVISEHGVQQRPEGRPLEDANAVPQRPRKTFSTRNGIRDGNTLGVVGEISAEPFSVNSVLLQLGQELGVIDNVKTFA